MLLISSCLRLDFPDPCVFYCKSVPPPLSIFPSFFPAELQRRRILWKHYSKFSICPEEKFEKA